MITPDLLSLQETNFQSNNFINFNIKGHQFMRCKLILNGKILVHKQFNESFIRFTNTTTSLF